MSSTLSGYSSSNSQRQSSPSSKDLGVELKTIHGDLHSLRTQFRQLHSKVKGINPEDAARLRTEMHQHRQQFQAGMSQLTDTNALAKEVASVKSQVQSMSGGLQELGGMKKQIQNINTSLQQEVAGVKQQMQSIQTNLKDIASVKQQLKEVTSMKQQMQKELNEFQTLRREHKTVQQTVESVKRETDNAKRESAKAVQKEVSKLTAEIGTMKAGDMGSMKVVVANTSKDLNELRKQIYDSGVLVKKAEVEDHHDEHPPVGCIELGEDMFSARLLVRLGFEKAKQDAFFAMQEEEELSEETTMQKIAASSDSEYEGDERRTLAIADGGPMVRFDDVVSGIAVPDVQEGGNGYNKVTYGWLSVCLLTMFTQVLAVIVLLRHSFHAADVCRDKPADPSQKLTLRLAKGCAVFVAGTIMGKELMDTVNYVMVSELLMGHSAETLFSAFTRLCTIILIAVANVMSFTCSVNATDVFMNMTALSFLGDLGVFVLDVAKRGVLGHHVGKAMTELNFSISILEVYPAWFTRIRNFAVFFQFGFSSLFISLLVFVLEIPDCNPDGSSPGKVYDSLLPWNW